MLYITTKYSDGFSPLPLIRKEQKQTLSTFYKDPLISIFSNLMVQSITGNASLKDARVVCLSDFHYDTTQKYIRAQMINEILYSRKMTYKEIVFLLDGTQAGHEPDEWSYDKLIGKDFIASTHLAFGWDDMRLNEAGIRLISKVQILRLKAKKMEEKYISLYQQKSAALKNTFIPIEKILKKIDEIETKQKKLIMKSEKISLSIESTFEEIRELANKRDYFLNVSINKVLKKYPNSIIFVIAGAHHFKYTSSMINHIDHCVLKIKSLRKVVNFDEALQEVYGNISLSCD